MPYVDPSRRVVPVETDEEIAAQAERPKLEVYQLDNGDGTFSYFQKVYLANEPVISGEVSLVVDGEAPDADTLPDGTPVLRRQPISMAWRTLLPNVSSSDLTAPPSD